MTATTTNTPRTTEHGGRHSHRPGEWHVWRSGRRLRIARRAWPVRLVLGGSSWRTFEEARLHAVIQQEILFKAEDQADYVLVGR